MGHTLWNFTALLAEVVVLGDRGLEFSGHVDDLGIISSLSHLGLSKYTKLQWLVITLMALFGARSAISISMFQPHDWDMAGYGCYRHSLLTVYPGASCRVATTEPRAVFNPTAHLEGGHRGHGSNLKTSKRHDFGFSYIIMRYHECVGVCVCLCVSHVLCCTHMIMVYYDS